VLPADEAYARVVESAGASLWRDAIDRRVIDSLTGRTGRIIDAPEDFRGVDGKLPGIDDLPTSTRPADFDTDGDGMPNQWESRRGLDPDNAADGNLTSLSSDGYTNLEVYLDELTRPQAIVHDE
jgi:hypothetical protein